MLDERFLILSVLLTACSSLPSVLAPQGPLCDTIRKEFSNQATVICEPEADYYELAVLKSGSTDCADVVVLRPEWVPYFAANRLLYPLPDSSASRDYFPGVREYFGEYPFNTSNFYARPLSTDVPLLAFRRDIFQNHSLPLPLNLTALADAAAHFASTLPSQIGFQTAWCLAPNASCRALLSGLFNSLVWSFGGRLWDPSSMRVDGTLNSRQNEEALTLLARLFAASGSPFEGVPTARAARALCDGSAPMLLFLASDLRSIPCIPSPNIITAVIPGERTRRFQIGGFSAGLCPSLRGERLDAANVLLSKITGLEFSVILEESDLAPARQSVLVSAAPLGRGVGTPLALALPLLKEGWGLKERDLLLNISQGFILRALNKTTTPAAALASIARMQQALIDDAYPITFPRPGTLYGDVIIAFGAVGIVASAVLAALVLAHRDNPLMKVAAYPLLVLMCVGAALGCVGAILSTAPPSPPTCIAPHVLSAVGFIFVFGTMFAKTLRMFRIFHNPRLKRRLLTLPWLWRAVAVQLVLALALVAAAEAASPPAVVISTYAPLAVEIACSRENPVLFVAITKGLRVVYALITALLAYITRDFHRSFGETKVMSMAIYIVTFCIAIDTSIQLPPSLPLQLPRALKAVSGAVVGNVGPIVATIAVVILDRYAQIRAGHELHLVVRRKSTSLPLSGDGAAENSEDVAEAKRMLRKCKRQRVRAHLADLLEMLGVADARAEIEGGVHIDVSNVNVSAGMPG